MAQHYLLYIDDLMTRAEAVQYKKMFGKGAVRYVEKEEKRMDKTPTKVGGTAALTRTRSSEPAGHY